MPLFSKPQSQELLKNLEHEIEFLKTFIIQQCIELRDLPEYPYTIENLIYNSCFRDILNNIYNSNTVKKQTSEAELLYVEHYKLDLEQAKYVANHINPIDLLKTYLFLLKILLNELSLDYDNNEDELQLKELLSDYTNDKLQPFFFVKQHIMALMRYQSNQCSLGALLYL